jgi:hypothetical protein
MRELTKSIVNLFCWIIVLFMSGCVLLEKYEQIQVLRQLDRSQQELERYVKIQKNKFRLLVNDIQANQVKPFSTVREIIARYGDPIFINKIIAPKDLITKVMLYRDQLTAFSSLRIYLYFYEFDCLAYWEYQHDY